MPLKNPFEHLSKPQLYAVIGGTVLLGGIAEYAHHKSTGSWNPFTKATASTATGSAIDPVTNLPVSEDNQIDPITNLPYLAEAQQYGSVAAAEASVSAYGATSATGSGVGVSPASPGLDGSTNTAAGATSAENYTSAAAWAQAAQTGLEQISGLPTYNGVDIGTALGDYLQGEELTPAQIQVVNIALSEFPFPGTPPQVLRMPNAVAALPPSNSTGTPTLPTAPGGPAKATVKIPNVVNQDAATAETILQGVGLRPSIRFTATSDKPGIFHIITKTSPAVGTNVPTGTTVTLYYRDSTKS
jgi:hypothetical protein